MATTADLTGRYAGQDVEYTLSVKDDDGANKVLTGSTITFTLNTDTKMTLTTTSGGITIDTDTTNQCTITIAASDWPSGTEAGRYAYQIKVLDSASKTSIVRDGDMTVEKML